MRMKLNVTYANGSGVDAIVSAPDFVAFEREFDRSVARFESEVKFTDICWLAWHKLHRDGKAAEFNEWLEDLDSVAIMDTEEPAPLDKTAPISH